MLRALSFAIIAAIGIYRLVIGPGWGLLPLLVVGPAVAAAVGGPLCTLAAGAAALAVWLMFAASVLLPGGAHRMTEVAVLAWRCHGGRCIGQQGPGHRDRELAQEGRRKVSLS